MDFVVPFPLLLHVPEFGLGTPPELATELATGKERARAEPVTSTATFRVIRDFILTSSLPWSV
jgi:hypothetical protein